MVLPGNIHQHPPQRVCFMRSLNIFWPSRPWKFQWPSVILVWIFFLELYSLPPSSIRFAGDETTLTTGLVLSGFSETLFSSFVGVIGADDPFPAFTRIPPVVLVVNPWVVGAWVEFNAAGLLEVLVALVTTNWLPTPLVDVRLDALLDNADELLPVKKINHKKFSYNKINYHSMNFFFLFIDWEPTAWPTNNWQPTNNGLLMHNST